MTKTLRLQPGLFGFEGLTEYSVEMVPGWDGRLEWLQPLDEPQYRFLCIDPLICRPDYLPDLPAALLDSLQLKSLDEAIVRCICRFEQDPRSMTANLLAPVIINPLARLGRQIALQDERYSIRQPVFAGMGEGGADAGS